MWRWSQTKATFSPLSNSLTTDSWSTTVPFAVLNRKPPPARPAGVGCCREILSKAGVAQPTVDGQPVARASGQPAYFRRRCETSPMPAAASSDQMATVAGSGMASNEIT